jgi:hypothetical protein
MIYEQIPADLRAIAGQITELSTLMGPVADQIAALGRLPDAGIVRARVGVMLAQTARLEASAVRIAGLADMNAAIVDGLAEFVNIRDDVANRVQAPFQGAVDRSRLVSPDSTRANFIMDAIIDQAEAGIEGLQETGTFPAGPSYNIGRIRGTIDDLASYPILTSDGGGGGGAIATPNRGPEGMQAKVDGALRATLGRLPKYTDSKSFLSALTSTFDVTQVEGRTVTKWHPRTYVGQTELGGGVTGAQASLYARARDALNAALPLLKALRPLRPDADTQEMDAARSIVQSQFISVVEELGTEGGPRPARVDQLFEALLTQQVIGIGNRPVAGGMVGYLADTFGFTAGQINTVDEEQGFSDFLLLRDYIQTTRDSWNAFRRDFLGRDLGTRLVLLSNALQVVAESVDEVTAALDSVFVGAGERSVAEFSTGPGQRMLVSELLSWVTSFATSETRDLVQSGGRRAMGVITATAVRLDDLIGQLIQAAASDPGLPRGMRHPRVRNPLEELRTYLRRVTQLARDVEISQNP